MKTALGEPFYESVRTRYSISLYIWHVVSPSYMLLCKLGPTPELVYHINPSIMNRAGTPTALGKVLEYFQPVFSSSLWFFRIRSFVCFVLFCFIVLFFLFTKLVNFLNLVKFDLNCFVNFFVQAL